MNDYGTISLCPVCRISYRFIGHEAGSNIKARLQLLVTNRRLGHTIMHLSAIPHAWALSEFYIICIMRCASSMFANVVVDSCSMCIRKKYFQFDEPVEHVHKCKCAE